MGDLRDHVLVGADAARQDLGDVGVGNHREAEVDGTGGRGVLFVVHLAERQHEGEHPPLVVEQDLTRLLEVARLEAAERHGRAAGEAERMHDRRRVRAIGHQEVVPAHIHAAPVQLCRHAVAGRARPHEHQDVALLQVARQPLGRGVVGQRAHTRRKARHAAVDQLDALLAQDAVGRRPEPEVGRERGAEQRLERLHRLVRQQRGRSGVERAAEVGQPQLVVWLGREPALDLGDDLLEIAQPLHALAEQRQRDGQRIGRGLEAHGLIATVPSECFREPALGASDAGMGATNGGSGNDSRHAVISGDVLRDSCSTAKAPRTPGTRRRIHGGLLAA